LQILNQKNVS